MHHQQDQPSSSRTIMYLIIGAVCGYLAFDLARLGLGAWRAWLGPVCCVLLALRELMPRWRRTLGVAAFSIIAFLLIYVVYMTVQDVRQYPIFGW